MRHERAWSPSSATNKYVDHAFRLMEENARQILSIVKGTFPGLDFDARVRPSYCSSPHSDGEFLNCLWFEATRGAAQGQSLVVGDQSLDALKEVRCQYPANAALANQASVLQACPKGHEQHSQQLQRYKPLYRYWHSNDCPCVFFVCGYRVSHRSRCNGNLDNLGSPVLWHHDVCE